MSVSNTSSARAIPLIAYDEQTNSYTVNEEAVAFLDSLGTRHIGVTTTVGKYRTGKSSFTNQGLLRCEPGNGFPVGGTINACTKGVWIYTEALKGKLCDCIVVLDTEGIGALDSTSNHDARIFSLGLLLSSYFILNSMHSIDEMALSHLSLVTRVSECICLSVDENADDIFPDFLWLLRDFTLTLSDESGKAITENQYLENALQHRSGAPEEKNEIRATIKQFLRNRKCHTLPPPYANAKELQDMSKLSFKQFPKEFAQRLNAVRNDVLANVRVKTAGGQPLTGHLLAVFAKHLVKAINSGHAPVLKDAWSAMAAERLRDAYDRAVAILESGILEARQACSTYDTLASGVNAAVDRSRDAFKEGCARQRVPDDLKRKYEAFITQRTSDVFRTAIEMSLERLEYRLEHECSDIKQAHALIEETRRETKASLNIGALFVDLWDACVSAKLWPIVRAGASGGAGRSKETVEKLEAVERECTSARQRLLELESTLESERERSSASIGECERAADAMRIEVDALQEQLESAQRRVRDMEEQLAEARKQPLSRGIDTEEEEKEKQRLLDELNHEKARIVELENRLTRADEEHSRQLQEVAERVESAREDLERHKQQLVRQAEEARSEADKYRTALDTWRLAHKETMESAQKQHLLLLAEKDEVIRRLNEEQSKKQSEHVHTLRQLEREKARAETHADSLKRRLDECDGENERKRLRSENNEVRVEAARSSAKADLLDRRCSQLEETVARQREEISTLQRNLEAERTRARLAGVEKKIRDATNGV